MLVRLLINVFMGLPSPVSYLLYCTSVVPPSGGHPWVSSCSSSSFCLLPLLGKCWKVALAFQSGKSSAGHNFSGRVVISKEGISEPWLGLTTVLAWSVGYSRGPHMMPLNAVAPATIFPGVHHLESGRGHCKTGLMIGCPCLNERCSIAAKVTSVAAGSEELVSSWPCGSGSLSHFPSFIFPSLSPFLFFMDYPLFNPSISFSLPALSLGHSSVSLHSLLFKARWEILCLALSLGVAIFILATSAVEAIFVSSGYYGSNFEVALTTTSQNSKGSCKIK